MRLIDADALNKDVLDLPNCYNGFSDTYDKACIIGLIDEQPTIEERKTGRWIATHEIAPFSNPDSITYVCSECGYKRYTLYGIGWEKMNYCPHCGAQMEKTT